MDARSLSAYSHTSRQSSKKSCEKGIENVSHKGIIPVLPVTSSRTYSRLWNITCGERIRRPKTFLSFIEVRCEFPPIFSKARKHSFNSKHIGGMIISHTVTLSVFLFLRGLKDRKVSANGLRWAACTLLYEQENMGHWANGQK